MRGIAGFAKGMMAGIAIGGAMAAAMKMNPKAKRIVRKKAHKAFDVMDNVIDTMTR